MSRGGSAGGGQSSLGYLFGGSEPPKPAVARATPAPAVPAARAPVAPAASAPAAPAASAPAAPAAPAPAAPAPVAPAASAPAASAPAEKAAHAKADVSQQIPAGIQGSRTNNYHRADGQNTGNFLTDRPSTKVHSAPGGNSTLDYLFGGK